MAYPIQATEPVEVSGREELDSILSFKPATGDRVESHVLIERIKRIKSEKNSER